MPVRRFLGSFVMAVLAGMACLAPVCDLWCHSGCLGPGALSPSPPCHGHERDNPPAPRGHHHSPATAPEQQCGGANSSLVAARVLVKPHLAVTAALDLWSELPELLRPLNSVLAVRSLPHLGSYVLPDMGLSRVLRI